MRKSLSLIFVIVIALLFGVFYQQTKVIAGDDKTPEIDVKAGVWRDGKAVFSDIKILDLFWPYSRGYKPEQPIAFSHKLHVINNKMECQYCHSGVAKSSYATLPSVETCMGCHQHVKTESEEIKKLKDYYDRGEPIPCLLYTSDAADE